VCAGAIDGLPRDQKAGARSHPRWRKGEIKTERYWQPDFSHKLKITEEEAGERAIEICVMRFVFD